MKLNPFKVFSDIKKRKIEKQRAEEEAEALRIAEQKRIYRKTKEAVDAYIYKIDELDIVAYRKASDFHRQYAHKKNSVCPICGSKKIHEEYKRIVGKLSGNSSCSGYSSYSHGLFYGSGGSSFDGSGKIDGSLDTKRILKCSECGHEWERTNESLPTGEYYSGKINPANDINRFMRHLRYIIEVEFDPKDITEKYDSYEEKRKVEIDRFLDELEYLEYMKDIPIEVLWALTVKYDYHISETTRKVIWSKKFYKDCWGDTIDHTDYGNERDKYICEFSPEAMSLLEELGFKHIDI